MENGITFDMGDFPSYHLAVDTCNPYVLSGGSPERIEELGKLLDDSETIVSGRKHVTVHGTYEGVPITAFSTGMGPASVSITLPEIIEASKDPHMVIVRLGTAGALQPYLNCGDLVATTWVDRWETTSDSIHHPGFHDEIHKAVEDGDPARLFELMANRYRAGTNEDVRHALARHAEACALDRQSVYLGPTRVVDELYRNALRVKERGKPAENNVLAVSMEISAYCADRDWYNTHRGTDIRVGNLLMIADQPLKDMSMEEFFGRKKELEQSQLMAGLQTLVELAHQ